MIKKIVMISDTHMRHNALTGKIPECDLLIHAGDMTGRGEFEDVMATYEWLEEQPARNIVTIPGNHEKGMERDLDRYLAEIKKRHPAIHVLIDQTVEIEGIKVHGSPITPWFYDWAWNRSRGPNGDVHYYSGKTKSSTSIYPHWDLIPDDVQILVTHGPPAGIRDIVYAFDGVTVRDQVGCQYLMETIEKRLKSLKLHVFGHIHGSSGVTMRDGVTYVNASICDEQYYPSYPPRIIEFDDEFSKGDDKTPEDSGV